MMVRGRLQMGGALRFSLRWPEVSRYLLRCHPSRLGQGLWRWPAIKMPPIVAASIGRASRFLNHLKKEPSPTQPDGSGMSNASPDSTTRDSMFALLRDTKWLAAVSILLSGILSLPDQIQELYRSILADRNLLDLAFFYVPLFLIGVIIWFGANQVMAASEVRTKSTTLNELLVVLWPAFLGSAPLFSSALAQFYSVPTGFGKAEEKIRELINTPGSVWDKLDVELASSAGEGLIWSGRAMIVAAIIFFVATAFCSVQMKWFAQTANKQYLGSLRFLSLTVLVILVSTASFVLFPVVLPQTIGVFGIVALFTLCIVAFCTHFSLLTIKFRFPFIPLILASAVGFSLLDLNDNHEIRLLDAPILPQQVPSVEVAFENWYSSRPDRQTYSDEYPVYIVAAQGGGIYAAYQTALFLARMQDICPAFRDHLFAVSAVSGGSVGAAVFASGLQLASSANSASTPAGPCPEITSFLNKAPLPSGQPKTIEKYVRSVLSTDLLSPLVAAALFTDFSQRFVPRRIPFLFDRASAFEYALEAAATPALTEQSKQQASSISNLLQQSYFSHWNANGSVPALLFNATDVGSGRRVLFSPFSFGNANSTVNVDSLIQFYSIRKSPGDPTSEQTGLNPRLSTAASISARFPWITPAATVKVKNEQLFGPVDKIRLVDGGYIDNSGVETALDLKEELELKVKAINADTVSKKAASNNPNEKYPKIVVKLIVLSGGTYATRDSFALGETLEPIRALLSTRQSRAYVAINRGARTMPPVMHAIPVHGTSEIVTTSDFQVSKLKNQFYDLALGWSMSHRTRDIIERQSGRYWDCEFGRNFTQLSIGADSETDCLQLLIYHQLNQSIPTTIVEVATANHYRGLFISRTPPSVRFSNAQKNEIIRCYVDKNSAWSLSQTLIIHALLDEWNFYPERKDDRMLAYLLGTASHETLGFRVFTENLSYPSPERIYQVFRKSLASLEEAKQYANDPQALANRVYGFPGNRLGNTREGDGWRYRARGIAPPLWGRSNYQFYASLTSTPELVEEPDLLLNRFIAARVAFAFFFVQVKNRLDQYFNDNDERWVEARKALPGIPVDPNDRTLLEGANEVAAAGRKFFECIKKVKQPSVR
jgi:predicted chitinase